ncbi:uncharacterized protein LOC117935848 [Etheostoma cragini]|uniref:uncharacterized protein LOC117935848 n=1 Tax=Etheostoma cragini TaxID=417921 RepID=UPI00155E6F2D|nr:uncharacterized protein LOC117935848 [Etheostoma cragini]
MASLTVLLLHLLLMLSSASAWYYSYYGGSMTFTPKGRDSNGTQTVQLHNTQTSIYCYVNYYSCSSGDCGSQTETTSSAVAINSLHFNWCQYDVDNKINLNSNLPFEIKYPTYVNSYYGLGFWASNFRSSFGNWVMTAHVDLGTRSDTGESNSSPVTAMLPVLRVPRNCPRTYNMAVFDPDGDKVRCRVPTNPNTNECGLCGLTAGFSFDQNSCTLKYINSNQYGTHPIELVVEDFPNKPITLSYSDGSYTTKHPLSELRRKRAPTTAAPTTAAPTTAAPTTAAPTTAAPTTVVPTTAAPTTAAPTTAAPTTAAPTTAAPTTAARTTAAPTTAARTTAAPTTAAPTTAAPTTAAPTTVAPTTAAPTTAAPTTAAPTTAAPTTAAPTTAAPTTAAPTTAAPTTAAPTTAAPTTAAPTTAAPTTRAPTTVAPTTAAPTTPAPTTAAPTTVGRTTAAPTTAAPTTAAPTTAAPTTVQPYRATIAPLSQLPLQFTVYVDYHNAPSCLDGDYFPVFSSPTPRNGVNLPAYVNRTLEIKVKSEAQYTTIHDLIVTGPQGIWKQRISTEEFIIKWIPTQNDLNDHFPICFVSEARDMYYQVFQSEPRCVIVDVGSDETTVTCNETTITVEVEKTSLIKRNEANLHLKDFSDAACDLKTRSNSTHLVAVMSLNTCGTTVEEDENNIIFKNMITSGDPAQVISRQNDVEIVFSCAYPKRTNLTLGFTHKNPYVFTEKGFGAFTFQFEFFQSPRFRKQINSSTYPVEVYLKQMIFMQIEATSSIPNVELFVESCKATPYDNPNSRISYTIIDNGCVKDNTVRIYNGSKSQFRFGMEAFEFIGAHEEVYITCSVILCETGVPGSRCSQGCIDSYSGNPRVRREAVAQTSRHTISQGPLHLAKASDSPASGPSLNMGLNIIFIVGCLLACGVVIYRSRRSKAKYQPLPTSETD